MSNERKLGVPFWTVDAVVDARPASLTLTWCVGVECTGARRFLIDNVPCIFYSGHRFVSTFLFSLFFGWCGVDRLCLGHTATGLAKLFTLGGVGIWWLVDMVLLATGHLMPADSSNFEPLW